jgi:hypothetical protein
VGLVCKKRGQGVDRSVQGVSFLYSCLVDMQRPDQLPVARAVHDENALELDEDDFVRAGTAKLRELGWERVLRAGGFSGERDRD